MSLPPIEIKNPCNEDWNSMAPDSSGRHCLVCNKTVIDFTTMTDAEVIAYFENLQAPKICGRFKNEQVQQPIHKPLQWQSLKPLKYAAVGLLALQLAACNPIIMGKTKEKPAIIKGALIAPNNSKNQVPVLKPYRPTKREVDNNKHP